MSVLNLKAMKRYIFVFSAILTLHSCSSPEKPVGTRDSLTVKPSETGSLSTKPVTFEGLYTFGNEVNTFQDCNGSKTVYWVNDSLTNLRDKYKETTSFLSYPYESVYAEVKGYLSGKSSLGYASEYENVLVVTDIIKLEAKNFRTECYNYEFIALGNEPFWSVDIIPQERRIILKDVGQEKVYEFFYAPQTVSGGIHRYESTNPARDKLIIEIREEKCSDGMSDRQYNYSAEVRLNERLLKGCAIKKGEQFSDQPG